MRLMVTTDVVGGVWTYTQELVEGIIREGHEVVLVSLGRSPSIEQRSWAEGLSRSAAHFRYIATGFKLEWMPDGHKDLERSAQFLLTLMEEERPDVFHSNQFCYGALPCAIPRVVVGHSDVVSWWHARYGAAPPADRWFERYRSVVGRGLRSASAVVTPSAWMRSQLGAHYGVNLARCRVIPNGRGVQAHPSASRRMQAVTAGRLWDEGKNLALLLHAPIDLPVFVAGDAALDDSGVPETSALHGEGQVNPQLRFLGALRSDALQTLMRESAFYIATSIYEPFGLAPLEAALAGCALVLSDIPSLREIWADTAVFFDPHDAGDLASAIRGLQGDPSRRLALAAAAQARAVELYSAQAMTAGYLHLYAELNMAAQPWPQQDAFVA